MTLFSGLSKHLKSCAYTHFQVRTHACTHTYNFKITPINHQDWISISLQPLTAYSSLPMGGPWNIHEGIYGTIFIKEKVVTDLIGNGERVEEFGGRNKAIMVVMWEIIQKGK